MYINNIIIPVGQQDQAYSEVSWYGKRTASLNCIEVSEN